MPILAGLKRRLAGNRPFDGLSLGICLHVEAKTAVWIDLLVSAGARVRLTGSPGTTQDDVAQVLARLPGVEVFGARADTPTQHLQHCRSVLQGEPDLLADNGGDLHALLATEPAFARIRERLLGATEETTSGGQRLREELPANDFATYVINDTQAKRVVENRYGVGASVVDGLMRATNLMLHGKTVLVIGYGYCGSGIAQRLRGLGAHVVVVERAPLLRLEAHLEGFRCMSLAEALPLAQLVVTVTGRSDILGEPEFALLRHGCLLANAGHFSTEIDLAALSRLATAQRAAREAVVTYTLPDMRELHLLAAGNPVNLAAGDGNPVEIMDLGLALQTLSLERLARDQRSAPAGIHPVPHDIETEVARLANAAWIDRQDVPSPLL